MTGSTADPIREGLEASARGDLHALEAVLDEHVTLHAVEPGRWDCSDRDHVMRLLQRRKAEDPTVYPVRIERVDDHTFIVQSDKPIDTDGPEPFAVATRVTVAAGRVVAMRQYRAE
jgi:ketosteroid isomerase-like protein